VRGTLRAVNVKLVLEYDGGGFAGWQLQVRDRTVEGVLREALGRLPLRVDALHAAGRTDAGAHAEGQVVSVRGEWRLPAERLRAALNAHLPPDVAVLSAEAVDDAFHARYSARSRHYRYRWLDRPARPALDRGRCWHLAAALDVPAMDAAALALVGRHDWTTFCTADEPDRSRVREIHAAAVARHGRWVDLALAGDGFLRGMIRSIAGALTEVGRGHRPPDWPAQLLAARDRALAPQTAPAAGLTLVHVDY
jgi:tRNA pseudouridine38-40 synthase